MLSKPEFIARGERIGQVPDFARPELMAYQSALLARMVRHAYEVIPFYRDLFDRHRVTPGEALQVSDLSKLPITRREQYQAEPLERLIPPGGNPNQLLVERTSGSTGVPMTTRQTPAERHLYLMLRSRTFKLLSPKIGGRFTYLGATRGPHDPSGMFTQVDCRQPIEDVARAIVDANPDTLIGFPGALCELASRAPREALQMIQPQLVIGSGEVLDRHARELLAETFGADVTQTYASSEFFWMGGECAASGELHLVDDSLVLEVVDEQGRAVPPGTRGTVVATALHSFAQPLIRYAIGDLAVQGQSPVGGARGCSCGSPFSTLGEVQGRELDYLVTPSGARVHAFTFTLPLREGAKFMQQYQVVQERPDFIRVRIVCRRPPEAAELASLRSALEAVLPGVQVAIDLEQHIAREANGKFKVVVSKVAAAPT